MRVVSGQLQCGVGVGRRALMGTLCAMMIAPPVFAAEALAGVGTIPVEKHTAALTQQEKVLHALNRFTFGPKPGMRRRWRRWAIRGSRMRAFWR